MLINILLTAAGLFLAMNEPNPKEYESALGMNFENLFSTDGF
jgi:hypothetical protein